MKRLKIIATFMLVFIMAVGFSTPTMAAELSGELVNSSNVESTDYDNVARSGNLIKSYIYNGFITKGKTLDSVTLNSRAKTIQFCVNGTGGNVIIRLTNPNTGDSRSFTATANSTWGSITYVSYMSTGTYNVSVEYVSGLAHTQLQMKFYD